MKLLTQYRNLPSQHINALWDDVHKDGVKAEKIREILLFYLHHRTCLPPLQKVFDTLIITLTGKLPSKKMKLLLFQCVEEICHWLDPECIVNTVKLVSNTTTTVELLSCFLINSVTPLPSVDDYLRLISIISSEKITQEDGCKILTFVTTTCPSSVVHMLSQQMVTWLRYNRDAISANQLFSKPDVREVDRTAAKGLCTTLTLTSKVTDGHMWCISVFSLLRTFLSRPGIQPLLCADMLNVVIEHCSVLVDQCLKNTTNVIDKQLQSTVLQEVLYILNKVVKFDSNLLKECSTIVERIETHAIKIKDVAVCIQVWNFVINFGGESETPTLCLDDFISRNFTQGNFSYDLSALIVDHADTLALSLCKYYPNLLKIIATHPSSLVEEFMEVVQHLVIDEKIAVEVLHGLLDLPVLSAAICVQQAPILRQAGIKDPVLLPLLETIRIQYKPVYNYFMRSTAFPSQFQNVFSVYQDFFSTLKDLVNYGLVQTSSQIAPLLLDSFLNRASEKETLCEKLLPVLLHRSSLIFEVPGYQQAVTKLIATHLQAMITCHPKLVNEPCILKFISAASNSISYPLVYTQLISAVGKCSDQQDMVIDHFDAVECCLYEVLAEKHNHPLVLLNVMTNALAKLSSRSARLIPRTLNALEKVMTQVQASDMDKQIVIQHNQELKCLLHNPYIANVVLSPATKQEVSVLSIMRVLNHLSQSQS